MPAYRITASRHGATCAAEYAHDVRIHPGQRTLVTTYFPSDEHVRYFGVPPLSAHRSCLTCTAQKLREFERIGRLEAVAGLTAQVLIDCGMPAEVLAAV